MKLHDTDVENVLLDALRITVVATAAIVVPAMVAILLVVLYVGSH